MWRRSSAASRASSLRATLAARVPACLIASPGRQPPILAVRRTREVGILSLRSAGPYRSRARPSPPAFRRDLRLTTSARGSSLHLGAGHDVVRAVGPPDPRLVAAVVVVAAAGSASPRSPIARARLRALGVEAAPDRGRTRLCSSSSATVVGSVWPGWIRVCGGQRQQLVHDRALEVGVGRVAGRAHAADRALEQRVAGEHVRPGRPAATASRRCGRGCGSARSAARPIRSASPGSIVPGRAGHQVALERMDQHRRAGLRREHRVELARRGREW